MHGLHNENHMRMMVDHDIPISYWLFFKNKRAMVASLTAIVSMIIMLFFECILSDELLSVGISQDYIGKIYAYNSN